MALPEVKLANKEWRMQYLYMIQRKDRGVSRMQFNPVQKQFWGAKSGRNIILKARQFGFSTLIDIHLLDAAISHPNTTCVILAHKKDALERLFSAVHYAYQNMAPEIKPNSKQETKYHLKFDNGSEVYVDLEVRGDVIHLLHVSEAAFMLEAHKRLSATMEACTPGAEIHIESTPNGMGGWYYDTWTKATRGESEFRPHFYPWFKHSEYQLNIPLKHDITDEENKLALSRPQIAWRRRKIARLGWDLFKQEYPEDDISCFLMSGGAAFDLSILQRMLQEYVEPRIGTLLDKTFVQERGGTVALWDEPEPGEKYVIGVDPAEGLEHGDFSTATVVRAHSPRLVARVRGHIDPTALTDEVRRLSAYYNRALVCCERNNHGQHVIPLLTDMRVPQYRYKAQDKRSARISDRFGFLTTRMTKPILVDDLRRSLIDDEIDIPDKITLQEMMGFIRNDDGSFSAAPGKTDDLVMSLGLAMQALRMSPVGPVTKPIKYPDPLIPLVGM